MILFVKTCKHYNCSFSVECKENEEVRCGAYDCQEFCDVGPDPLCDLNKYDCWMMYECICKPGFIRIDDSDCIPIENCPKDVLLLEYDER